MKDDSNDSKISFYEKALWLTLLLKVVLFGNETILAFT